jgi:hypothetical protein
MHEMSAEEEFSELEGLSLDDMYKEMAGEV